VTQEIDNKNVFRYTEDKKHPTHCNELTSDRCLFHDDVYRNKGILRSQNKIFDMKMRHYEYSRKVDKKNSLSF